MKHLIINLVVIMLLASCSSDKPSYLEPQLSTLAASDITRNEATLNGIAEIEGDADMPQLYFRYGTTENMDQTVPITTESDKISKQNNVSVRLKISLQAIPIIICCKEAMGEPSHLET